MRRSSCMGKFKKDLSRDTAWSRIIKYSIIGSQRRSKEEQITYIDMDMIAPNKLNDFSMDSLEQIWQS